MITNRINYVIAAAAHRTGEKKTFLKLHLQNLLKTCYQDLSQITIIRALPLDKGQGLDYYDINNELQNFQTA